MEQFIDLCKKLPNLGELVLVNLKNGRQIRCFRTSGKDESNCMWADPIVGIVINIEVVSWKYVK